ncbi:glycosyltransferase family 4 protein [Frederiksenia canicola]
MNIWCISKYASPPKYSKMPTRLFNYCQEWVELGHDVTLFTSDSNHLANYPETEDTYNYELIDKVPVYWVRTKKYTKIASVSRVLSWFDFERKLFCFDEKSLSKPDVIIVSSLSLFSIVYGYYLKKKYKAKLIFEIRDIWPLTLTEEGGFSKWHPLVLFMGWVEKFGYNVSDLIVGTMPRLDKHIETIINKKFKFYCAPFGFKPENYTKDVELLCKNNVFDNILPKNKVIIGYAGSMGITNALESFVEVIKDMVTNEKIHFALVGSGDLRSMFEEQLFGCQNVTFLSRIPQNDVKFFLAKCDVLYLSAKPSKVWSFGQSLNKISEYMLAGKPIVASFSGYPSMINEAECGFFVKPNDNAALKNSLLKISEMTPQEREDIGKNGLYWMWENRKYSTLAKNYMDKLIEISNYD